MKNEIEKFDNYLKQMSKNRLNTLGEVSFILLDLMKKKSDANIDIEEYGIEPFDTIDYKSDFLKNIFPENR